MRNVDTDHPQWDWKRSRGGRRRWCHQIRATLSAPCGPMILPPVRDITAQFLPHAEEKPAQSGSLHVLAVAALRLATSGIVWCPHLHLLLLTLSPDFQVSFLSPEVRETSSASYLRVSGVIWAAAGLRKANVTPCAPAGGALLGDTHTHTHTPGMNYLQSHRAPQHELTW